MSETNVLPGSCETESKISDRIAEIIAEISTFPAPYMFTATLRELKLALKVNQAWEKMTPEEAIRPFYCPYDCGFETMFYPEMTEHKREHNSLVFVKKPVIHYEEPF
jgi:hypothetical protein